MKYSNLATSSGSPLPLGCTIQKDWVNFSVYAEHAQIVVLGLFQKGTANPEHIIPLQRTGNHWHIALPSLAQDTYYGFQCNNQETWLFDPYAKIIDAIPHWRGSRSTPLLGLIENPLPFSWEGVTHPNINKEDLIIYEMHARGFTIHPSSKTLAPGTYEGIMEKIPYLQQLGVNAIELMPIFEFDETNCDAINPITQEKLPNYWGYDPISFFMPKRNYAKHHTIQGALQELKTLVLALHKQKIEIILDVVYNHTGKNPLKSLDRKTYYLLDPNGEDKDYTGCKNTINANSSATIELILTSLRYWVTEFHIDGFRFDLASILTRDEKGHPLNPSPLIQAISQDPLLSQRKLIAEPWDAVGLYQLGNFPNWGPWSEWNDKYRDNVRRFIKGTSNTAGPFANAISGNEWIYPKSNPLSSINFITAHDGFCLRDLVTYQSKHNLANGDQNRDGSNHNENWNCGTEGPTLNRSIVELRERQMRNFWLALFLSQGIPMMLMGDEYGHTRSGNNNPYVQDNEFSWFSWDELEKNKPMFQFVQKLIAFRKKHPEFRRSHFITPSQIQWHGFHPNQPDWSQTSRFVAFTTTGSTKFYVAFNANERDVDVQLPDSSWHTLVNTQFDWDQVWFDTPGPKLNQTIKMSCYSAILASNEGCIS